MDTKNLKRFTLRLPVELHDKLEAIAEAKGNSLNSQIVETLHLSTLDEKSQDVQQAMASLDLLVSFLIEKGVISYREIAKVIEKKAQL